MKSNFMDFLADKDKSPALAAYCERSEPVATPFMFYEVNPVESVSVKKQFLTPDPAF